jgi:hypothetical protein
MKKSVITAALLCLAAASFALPASAETDLSVPPEVSDSDPCKVVFCMFGHLKGENPSECRGAVNHYFNIVKKKKGKFKPADTAKERLKFMNSCPGGDSDSIKQINNKFGRLR